MTEITQPQEYRLLYTEGDEIIDNGTQWKNSLEEAKADFAGSNWAIIPVGEVPDNWRNMTIVDGVLVLASAEVIATREVSRGNAATEAARQARAVDYAVTTDPLWLEIQEDIARSRPDDPKCVAWLAAKEQIRQQYPKPITN